MGQKTSTSNKSPVKNNEQNVKGGGISGIQ